jgi:cholesterol oxidase
VVRCLLDKQLLILATPPVTLLAEARVSTDFDTIVIGSGFGGAVCAARLSAAGYRVLVLERGRRWEPENYPRNLDGDWIWDQDHPERQHGWFDFRVFPNMAVVQGAGVGGGSLVYANISINAKRGSFDKGWPPEITYDELAPYYERAGAILDVQKVPYEQWPERTRLLKEAARKKGWGDRFEPLDLAVTFDPDWRYNLPDPHNTSHSKTFTNAHGRKQGTCIHLGNCDIGCDVKAKNTLDVNYLAIAEDNHADLRPLHLVRHIAPEGDGYRVFFDRIQDTQLISGSATARLVVLGAGSLGSTELLLRSRDLSKTLPNISPFLGRNWSSNGDFLTPAIYPFKDPPVHPMRGPTITAAINFLDGDGDGNEFFIEDGGFPNLGGEWLDRLAGRESADARKQAVYTTARALRNLNLLDQIMPWFAQGRDAANGVMSLKGGRLSLQWDVQQSQKTVNAIVRTHEELARATGGWPIVPLPWLLFRDLITPHALGGANMGRTAADGVVDHRGEVFGYRNLFVADGAIVPEAIGLNPSKTIAALAERVAALIVSDAR